MTAPDIKEPCGECYLPSRETCDICGAIGPSPKVIASLPERIWTATTNGKCHVGFDTPSLNYANEYVRADLVRPTPLAEALAVPEVAALRVALAGLTAVLDAEDEEGDFLISAHGSQTILKRYATEKKNARAALRAIGEGK